MNDAGCINLVLRKTNETAGRPAMIEVFDSTICCESGPTCGIGNALTRNALMALSQNKESCTKDIINKVNL